MFRPYNAYTALPMSQLKVITLQLAWESFSGQNHIFCMQFGSVIIWNPLGYCYCANVDNAILNVYLLYCAGLVTILGVILKSGSTFFQSCICYSLLRTLFPQACVVGITGKSINQKTTQSFLFLLHHYARTK